jgi:hypothetical protein
MSFVASAIHVVEQTSLPDPLTRRGIRFLVGQTRRRLSKLPASREGDFARTATAVRNGQH